MSGVENDVSESVRVFVSYCRESAAHDGRVQTLVYHFAREGIDCVFDRQHAHEPLEGWMGWMVKNLRAADAVLVVCTSANNASAGRIRSRSIPRRSSTKPISNSLNRLI